MSAIKWTAATILVALMLVFAVSVSAHGSVDGKQSGKGGKRGTATPVPSATATYAPTPAGSPTPNPSEQQREQDTVNLINQRRAALGLGALRVDPALTSAAQRHSHDIGPNGLCQHNGTDGSSPWSRIADAGYTGSPTGEVVGCGFASAQAVVDIWWNSPSHYAILTDANANDVGCGWWINSAGYGWATCDLGWTSR